MAENLDLINEFINIDKTGFKISPRGNKITLNGNKQHVHSNSNYGSPQRKNKSSMTNMEGRENKSIQLNLPMISSGRNSP